MYHLGHHRPPDRYQQVVARSIQPEHGYRHFPANNDLAISATSSTQPDTNHTINLPPNNSNSTREYENTLPLAQNLSHQRNYPQNTAPSRTPLLPTPQLAHLQPSAALTTSGQDTTHLHDQDASINPHSIQPKSWDSATSSSLAPVKVRKPRRARPRIELAADQPRTTQGKPRARVYVACAQCRLRKIRCDGAKPVCHNCSRRASNSECIYDAIPKRRGPDKTPGARQRLIRDYHDELNGPEHRPRRRRTRKDSQDSSRSPAKCSLPTPLSLANNTDRNVSNETTFHVPHYVYISPSRCGCHDMNNCPDTLDSHRAYYHAKPSYESNLVLVDPNNQVASVTEVDENGNEIPSETVTINSGPSLRFTRKVWWDSLLSLYYYSDFSQPQYLTPSQRDTVGHEIASHLRFIFRASNYWFSFFHIPTFFRNFFDPVRREGMQPALVLALLAMSTFWQSSEVGMGSSGRERALRLRGEAQSALDASLSSGWIDESLAQAAWVLALFEVCAHPKHTTARSRSALAQLDSLIQYLSLTSLDANDPNASIFSPRSVPAVPGTTPQWVAETYYESYHSTSSHVNNFHGHTSSAPLVKSGCSCKAITLAAQWPLAHEHAPLWGPTPAWNSTWTEGEIRKESCRRLCWSSMILAAGHTSYTAATRTKSPELFIADPANYALLFSGESMARSPALSSHCSSKDTIWALHDRAFLLWHGCIRMRNDPLAADHDKAQFAVKTWLEADALEVALNRHDCNLERAFLFQGREYIFNTRMCISYEFQRYVPLATSNVSSLFHRSKAEEWLTHQVNVAQRFMSGLHTITGNSGNILARRPFFVFWLMGQISRSMMLWHFDNSLTIALEVCKALIPAIDYLTALWPCPEQRIRYEGLRELVSSACYAVGVPPPPPLNLALQLPSSVEGLV
ncbi:hypothetical protein AMATHDRAFT_186506 [Amanita thiersii Skay4041]|uniref:Zn(2)-C6 fungal-type domain-containing protein n=1 Tax=Amanita thiersii Skay4041 TaxID=703135 RepID=A0A2A9P0D8_9AGAR|nr:hypothetical protein AMATHDRAFT_186506 [Amanita thiersii Skay4041]